MLSCVHVKESLVRLYNPPRPTTEGGIWEFEGIEWGGGCITNVLLLGTRDVSYHPVIYWRLNGALLLYKQREKERERGR